MRVNSPIPLYWKARSYAKYTHEGWLSEGTVLKEPGWQPEYSLVDPDQERFNVTFEVVPIMIAAVCLREAFPSAPTVTSGLRLSTHHGM